MLPAPHRFTCVLFLFVVLAALAAPTAAPADPPAAPPTQAALLKQILLATWGAEALAQIQKDFAQPGSGLYAEEGKPDGSRGNGEYGKYSFIWPASLQLQALAAASKLQPTKYLRTTTAFADALDTSRSSHA